MSEAFPGWDGSIAGARVLQDELAQRVLLRDSFTKPLRTIAGFDGPTPTTRSQRDRRSSGKPSATPTYAIPLVAARLARAAPNKDAARSAVSDASAKSSGAAISPFGSNPRSAVKVVRT